MELSTKFDRLLQHTCFCLSLTFLAALLTAGSFHPISKPVASASSRKPAAARAEVKRAATSNKGIDAVIVLDNINQIQVHDPHGDRFSAAQLFVDLALDGDNIGSLQLPDSITQLPQKLKGYHALTNMDAAGKKAVKEALASIGPTEQTNSAPYFIPALLEAARMLESNAQSTQDNNRKYIILVTDVLAESADQPQQNCAGVPGQSHNWLCIIKALAQQEHISVVLVGFAHSGQEHLNSFSDLSQYLADAGGIVEEVNDNPDVVGPQLGEAYIDLFSRINSNIFWTSLPGGGNTLTINQSQLQLQQLSFVALGNTPSLSDLRAPNSATSGSPYSPNGAIYALKTFDSAQLDLNGAWKLGASKVADREVLVVAVSKAYFDLISPTAADPTNVLSPLYLPDHQTIVLQATIDAGDGTPYRGALPQFEANPAGTQSSFTSNGAPGNGGSEEESTILNTDLLNKDLQIGLGGTLEDQSSVYLARSFQIKKIPPPRPIQLLVPTPVELDPQNAHVPIQAQINDPAARSLLLFSRDEGKNGSWQQISADAPSGAAVTSATGDFIPLLGCRERYMIAAVAELAGQTGQGQNYDYKVYSEQPYDAELKQEINGEVSVAQVNGQVSSSPDTTYLGWWWWSTTVTWDIDARSTACNAEQAIVKVSLDQSNFSVSGLTVETSRKYYTSNSFVTFTIPRNDAHFHLQMSVKLGNCSFGLSNGVGSLDVTFSKTPLPAGAFNVQPGQMSMTCPSLTTNTVRYWYVPPLTAFALFRFGWVPASQWRARRRKPYLSIRSGTVAYRTDDPLAPGGYLEARPLVMKTDHHSHVYYLCRKVEAYEMEDSVATDAPRSVVTYEVDVKPIGGVMMFFVYAEEDGPPEVWMALCPNAPLAELPLLNGEEPLNTIPRKYQDDMIIIEGHQFYFEMAVDK